MQQHPVPQNVTSYEFRLVGDMTLKQFLELAGGLVLAYLAYISNLVFFIKWPLVILFAFAGIALAFFPLEERPLDQWVVNFIKSIYNPTRYLWKKTQNTPRLFTHKTRQEEPEKNTTVTKQTRVQTEPPPTSSPKIELDQEEITQIETINALLKSSPVPVSAGTPRPVIHKPSVAIRKLSTPTTPPPPPPARLLAPSPSGRSATVFSSSPVTPPSQPKETIIFSATPSIPKSPPATNISAAQPLKTQMPLAPKDPNIVVGMVTAASGKLIEGAIVEITDDSGIPQRAVRTNQLGQFFISTPLPNGSYIVRAEKDGLTIPPYSLSVKGEVIPPLSLQAQV